jgi:F-type H+-transporting ATPase subunit gamma
MSDTVESLRRKIEKARSLGSVVRTMKTLAALSIRQYEEAVHALDDYYRTVELGLSACLRQGSPHLNGFPAAGGGKLPVVAVVFGSDQGLVGQFNDLLASTVRDEIRERPERPHLVAVGERIRMRLQDEGLGTDMSFDVPGSVDGVTPLTGDLLSAIEHLRESEPLFELRLFYHSPVSGELYRPVSKRLLPLDDAWERDILKGAGPWPGKASPETPNGLDTTFWSLVREYLFVSLYKACAESLASENASRLAAMQRAEKNIDDLLTEFTVRYNEHRQADIDEELFDVVSGFQALGNAKRGKG